MTPAELTQRREALGLSRAQLAAKLGLTRQVVYQWEAGDIKLKAWLALALERIEKPGCKCSEMKRNP